jgi:hypothetical protein
MQGEWVEGMEDGRGFKLWANGDRYEGGWRLGKRHGPEGVLSWGQGRHQYQGEWADDLPHGRCVPVPVPVPVPVRGGGLAEPQCTRHRRRRRRRRRRRQHLTDRWIDYHVRRGRVTLGDGAQYEGSWHRGQRHGHGKETLADGTRYSGGWAQDKREGHGEMHGVEDSYVGQWHDGQRHGQGEATLHQGRSVTRSPLCSATRAGLGLPTALCMSEAHVRTCGGGALFWHRSSSEKVYKGEWQNDMFHGRGELICADGRKYVGEWSEGKRHGQGKFWFKNGSWCARCPVLPPQR